MQAIQIAVRMVGRHRRRGASCRRRPGRTSPPRSASPARTPVAVPHALRQCRLDARPRPTVRRRRPSAPRRSSSTRPPTRPAGRRRADELRAILDFARERGLWIIADEVYHRFYYAGRALAVLLRRRRAGRPHPLRQHLLQELGDDRLADRLAVGAAGARPGHREPDPVFDLRRRRLHAARGDGRPRRGRRLHRACRSSAPAPAATSSAPALPPPAASASPSRTAPSICSSPSTASPTRASSASAWSTRPMSASRRATPSARRAGGSCASASPRAEQMESDARSRHGSCAATRVHRSA